MARAPWYFRSRRQYQRDATFASLPRSAPPHTLPPLSRVVGDFAARPDVVLKARDANDVSTTGRHCKAGPAASGGGRSEASPVLRARNERAAAARGAAQRRQRGLSVRLELRALWPAHPLGSACRLTEGRGATARRSRTAFLIPSGRRGAPPGSAGGLSGRRQFFSRRGTSGFPEPSVPGGNRRSAPSRLPGCG